jgi:hypothetical protein
VTHSNTSVTVGVIRGGAHCTRRRVREVPSGFMARRTESDMDNEELQRQEIRVTSEFRAAQRK